MVKIPTLTNQTTLDASPEPMVNPVANRTGEIMGKGIQQVGTVMHRMQQRQEYLNGQTIEQDFDSFLNNIYGEFEANEDMIDGNTLSKFNELTDTKINDILNNYQGSETSKQDLFVALQKKSAIYEANINSSIRKNQMSKIYDDVQDNTGQVFNQINNNMISIKDGIGEAEKIISGFGRRAGLGTRQQLELVDDFRSKVGIGEMEKFIQTGQIERGMNFLNDPKNKLIIDAMPANKRQSYQIRFNSLYEKSLYDNKNQKVETKEKTESMLKTFSQNKETAILALLTAVGDVEKASEYKTSSPQQRKKILNEMIKQGMSDDFDWTATGWGSDVLEWVGFKDPVELESTLSRLKATNAIKTLAEMDVKLTPLSDSDIKLVSEMQGSLDKRAPREMFRNLTRLITTYENMESKLKADYNLKYGGLPKQSVTQKKMTYNIDSNGKVIVE